MRKGFDNYTQDDENAIAFFIIIVVTLTVLYFF
jgi:hypothetical protein